MHAPILALLVLFVTQSSGKWTAIGTTNTGNPVFVNAKSITTDKSGVTTAEIRTVYTKPTPTPKGDITSVRSIAMFKCASGEVAAKVTTIFIDEKAGKIFETRKPVIPGFAKPFDNTYAAVAMGYVCKKK
jgi:hypothetical protein